MSATDYNELSAEITRLTGVWYELVNVDHHKDRDCHWTIETTWSYGEGPKFHVWHEGYVYKRVSLRFHTFLHAMVGLRDEVLEAIESKREWALRASDPANDDYWNADDAKKVLAILEKAGL